MVRGIHVHGATSRTVGALLGVVSVSALFELALHEWDGPFLPGGLLGRTVGGAARDLLSYAGSAIVLVAVLVSALFLVLRLSPRELATGTWKAVSRTVTAIHGFARGIRGEISRPVTVPAIVEGGEGGGAFVMGSLAPDAIADSPADGEEPSSAAKPRRRKKTEALADGEAGGDEVFTWGEPADLEPEPNSAAPVEGGPREPTLEVTEADVVASEPVERPSPTIVEPTTHRNAARDDGEQTVLPLDLRGGPYTLPAVSLLDEPPPGTLEIDREALLANARRLEAKLRDYRVEGEVREIHPGPVVTMYEFAPAPGLKLSRITSLSDDLALALEAERVRIVAPIPGKGVVGIEVPNARRETVFLREIIGHSAFRSGSKLSLAFGKDIAGDAVVADLARMPHLLVAGATGSGKSVSINSMIVSVLMNATPDEVRMIMVDPKMLELSLYDGIPHLLLPVVTDPKKAAVALRWAVEEMGRRYQLLSEYGVRHITGFNKRVEKLAAGLPEAPAVVESPSRRVIVKRLDQSAPSAHATLAEEADSAAPAPKPIPKKLPYIVIVIDELADLMMVASKDVESCICRLAQLARAAGIHLIVATQRPSVDVITGVIKANFPARVSFKVTSKEDSRTILGGMGAEKLLGNGDMLFIPPGKSDLLRVHGALVTEDEIKQIVESLKRQGAPDYDTTILETKLESETEELSDEDKDDMYDACVAFAADNRVVSTSLLQRKFSLGYSRAAKIMDIMERIGIVGPPTVAGKPREVLIPPLGA